MIDVEGIKERADLLALAGQYTHLGRVSGAEYAGPCPKCGGRDRFHVEGRAGWWFCRQCHEKRGDAIELLCWIEGLPFREACERLGGSPVVGDTMHHQSPQAPEPRPDEWPPATWQAAARGFVTMAQALLWDDPDALAYLRGRGLSDDTIRGAALGYWPKTGHRPGNRWGREKPVWIPRGWVIPCEVGTCLAYVKVRRLDADLQGDAKAAKYVCLAGSKPGGVLYGLADLAGHSDAILCEGEFDALLLRQYIGDMAGVAATGSAANTTPGLAAIMALAQVARVWIALDTDDAGEDNAQRWQGRSARVRRLAPLEHDVTDMWKAGHDLAAWVAQALGLAVQVATESMPPAIVAALAAPRGSQVQALMDAGLTMDEALDLLSQAGPKR